jgi:hypothetical protein
MSGPGAIINAHEMPMNKANLVDPIIYSPSLSRHKWAGVDNVREQEKLEARKILENSDAFHTVEYALCWAAVSVK